jgi:hypothetical protein
MLQVCPADAHRVRGALLIGGYLAALDESDWDSAARHLNGLDDPGIQKYVGYDFLSSSQMTPLVEASDRVNGAATTRVRTPILDRQFRAALDGARWQDAAQCLSQLSDQDVFQRISGLDTPQLHELQAAAQQGGHQNLLKIIAPVLSRALGAGDSFDMDTDGPPGEINLRRSRVRDEATYIDNVVHQVMVGIYLPGYFLYCEGQELPIVVPWEYVKYTAVATPDVDDNVYPNRDAALAAVGAAAKSGPPGTLPIAHYRAAGGLTAPTMFSWGTTPRIMGMLQDAMGRLQDEVQSELTVMAILLAAQVVAGFASAAFARSGPRSGRQAKGADSEGPVPEGLPATEADAAAAEAALDLNVAPTAEELAQARALCFAAGTPVATPSGLRSIETLAPGDAVYAYDFETRCVVVDQVAGVSTGHTSTWVDIHAGDTVLRATAAHPIWVESAAEWRPAASLEPGMHLRTRDGRTLEVSCVEVHAQPAPQATYNLHVTSVHTFFAGASQLLVHNHTLTKAELAHLNRAGYSNYTLRYGPRSPEVLAGEAQVGEVYYCGMFGPGDTAQGVMRRHAANNDRFTPGVDQFALEPGTRTYGHSRLLEHRSAVQEGTIIGRDPETFRGNRQMPINQNRLPLYEAYEQGCG